MNHDYKKATPSMLSPLNKHSVQTLTTNVSNIVAFRIYHLKSGTYAIAYNTITKNYMFLEGLSAELLQLTLQKDNTNLEHFIISNSISENEYQQYKHTLTTFGFYGDISNTTDSNTSDSLIDTELSNQSALNIFQNRLRENGLYYLFHIDLTNRCNERCIHCYHPFNEYVNSNELTTDEVKNLIDTIYELGVFCVTLSGGECLIRKDFYEILAYLSNKGMLTTIFTNGLALTEDVVKKIKEYRVKMVSISIYGDNTEIHDTITTIKGSFEKTMDGINFLKKHDIPFELKCIVLAENISRIEHIRALSQKLNYGQDCKIDFSLCGKVNGDCSTFSHKASYDEIKKVFFSNPKRYFDVDCTTLKEPTDSPCGAGKFGLYCSAEGDIFPCVSFRLKLCTHKDLSNISENTILKSWLSTKISDFSDCFKHSYCKYCTEQCAGNNLIENGDYHNSKNISNCERAQIIAEWFDTHSDNYKTRKEEN